MEKVFPLLSAIWVVSGQHHHDRGKGQNAERKNLAERKIEREGGRKRKKEGLKFRIKKQNKRVSSLSCSANACGPLRS